MLADASRDLDISSLVRTSLEENDVSQDTSGTTTKPSGTL